MARKLSQKIRRKLDEAIAGLGRKQLEEVIKLTPVTTSLKVNADLAQMVSEVSTLSASISAMGVTAKEASIGFGFMAKVLGGQSLPETEEEDLDIQQELSQ